MLARKVPLVSLDRLSVKPAGLAGYHFPLPTPFVLLRLVLAAPAIRVLPPNSKEEKTMGGVRILISLVGPGLFPGWPRGSQDRNRLRMGPDLWKVGFTKYRTVCY